MEDASILAISHLPKMLAMRTRRNEDNWKRRRARMEKADTMDAMLARLAKRCTLATIIDVGASTGCWSEVAARHWPAANLILIEADERHFDALADFQARHVCHIAHMMAGDHRGTRYLPASPTDPFRG